VSDAAPAVEGCSLKRRIARGSGNAVMVGLRLRENPVRRESTLLPMSLIQPPLISQEQELACSTVTCCGRICMGPLKINRSQVLRRSEGLLTDWPYYRC
jgi:hypothetical protein